jgi:hypothetical protein
VPTNFFSHSVGGDVLPRCTPVTRQFNETLCPLRRVNFASVTVDETAVLLVQFCSSTHKKPVRVDTAY